MTIGGIRLKMANGSWELDSPTLPVNTPKKFGKLMWRGPLIAPHIVVYTVDGCVYISRNSGMTFTKWSYPPVFAAISRGASPRGRKAAIYGALLKKKAMP